MNKRTVFVIGGGGMVGAAAANALAIKEAASEIVLIDVAEELAHGQAMDISHATAWTQGVRVRVGDYDQIREDDICVITCGLPQKPGQSRPELGQANAGIIRDVVTKIMAQGKPVFIVMVSNPVDSLTQLALEVSGLPRERVLGTGTTLDSSRLVVTLADHLKVAQSQVQAYILGEHGDSSFAAISRAEIGGIPLVNFPGYSPGLTDGIEEHIREAAGRIIAAKKSTYYGIGQVVVKVVEALSRQAGTVLPVCSMTNGEYGLKNVVIGLPSLVNSDGVQILDHYPLNERERKSLAASAVEIEKTYSDMRVPAKS